MKERSDKGQSRGKILSEGLKNDVAASLVNLGMSQNDWAEAAGVAQSTVSWLIGVGGVAHSVGSDPATKLIEALNRKMWEQEWRVSAEDFVRVEEAILGLKSTFGLVERGFGIGGAGGVMSNLYSNYINRPEDRRLSELLSTQESLGIVIEGPPQSGKSSLAASMVVEAQKRGIRSSYFDFSQMAGEVVDRPVNEQTGLLLSVAGERLIDDWRLQDSGWKSSESVGNGLSFSRWIRQVLSSEYSAKPLMVWDDLSRFDAQVRAVLFRQIFMNMRDSQVLHRDIITPNICFVDLGLDEIYYANASNSVRIKTGWFTDTQVSELLGKTVPSMLDSEEVTRRIFQYYNGQPLLTHNAIDQLYGSATPLADLEQIFAESTSGHGKGREHVMAVRKVLEFPEGRDRFFDILNSGIVLLAGSFLLDPVLKSLSDAGIVRVQRLGDNQTEVSIASQYYQELGRSWIR